MSPWLETRQDSAGEASSALAEGGAMAAETGPAVASPENAPEAPNRGAPTGGEPCPEGVAAGNPPMPAQDAGEPSRHGAITAEGGGGGQSGSPPSEHNAAAGTLLPRLASAPAPGPASCGAGRADGEGVPGRSAYSPSAMNNPASAPVLTSPPDVPGEAAAPAA